MKLVIDQEGDEFVVDEPGRPGTPPVGRGRTMIEALGSFFHNNQTRLGLEIEVAPSAAPAEAERRRRELLRR